MSSNESMDENAWKVVGCDTLTYNMVMGVGYNLRVKSPK